MKFIHAADIHLDSPLAGLSAYKDAPAEQLRNATREAFIRLIDSAIEEAVDFMVLAGDLYDGSWKDVNTGQFFCKQMGKLRQAGIPVYLLYGNHDADSEMTRKLLLPDNVHLFEHKKAQTHRIEALKVAFHGRSFKEAATTENLAASYSAPVPGWLNIGVLHTALEGYTEHANYAPCTVAELVAKGYQYWALGHVHEFAILHKDPWVVFPGNLQGRHIRETGIKGAVLVTADDGKILNVERLPVDVLRWRLLEIDCASANCLEQTVHLIGQAMEEACQNRSESMPLCLRIHLTGKTAAHGALFGLATQLRDEVLAQVAGRGLDIWVEKVVVATEPDIGDDTLANRSDAISDLQQLLKEAPDDEEFKASLMEELRPLLDKTPLDVLRSLPELEAIRQGQPESLIKRVAPDLVSYLAQTE